ncbi:hypothetical protein [Shewanella gaetbuli]|uniref:Cxxc_20_cxxc protein n=1 Tax=Shewanella gaetbuli TaxID=220752 RepID=A0A9X1ZF21_9GAMM|nr:hypothetical protein [Shewanella gaetbuli]MCL1141179.1 hypothetical protein [Shewanella gaetbuli]
MLLQCAFCHKSFPVSKETTHRGKGLGAHVKCPECGAWLGRNKRLTIGKLVGFYAAVFAGIFGYMTEGNMFIVTPVIILSIILVGVTHMMDHLVLIEPPEDADTNNTVSE